MQMEPLQTKGTETNARFVFKDNYKLFLGYTFTSSKAKFLPGNPYLPRVPKHKLNSALIYEKEGVIKVGLEGYFTGKQRLKQWRQRSGIFGIRLHGRKSNQPVFNFHQLRKFY